MKCKKGQYLDAKKIKKGANKKKGIFGFHDHNNRHGYSKDLNQRNWQHKYARKCRNISELT